VSGQLKLWPAECVGGLVADPDEAGLGEPFTYAARPGVWLVAKWSLCPKQGPTEGWWFPCWWEGPGTRTWQATSLELHVPHEPPASARFPSAQVAAAALARDDLGLPGQRTAR
jgi:hypothetical protein